MTNAQINQRFLSSTDAKTKNEVLSAIASHYGITPGEALLEVIDSEAEHLCDYLTGATRTAVSLLMKRHNLNG